MKRASEVIRHFMNGLLNYFPYPKFFIFNPNCEIYQYRFEYGNKDKAKENKVILKKL